MSGDVHVRFCEHLEGRFLRVTRLSVLDCQYVRQPDGGKRRAVALDPSMHGVQDSLHAMNRTRGADIEFRGVHQESL